MIRTLFAFLATVTLALALTAPASAQFTPNAKEQAELEMWAKPESWFIEHLKNPREVIEGQTLNPKLQYQRELLAAQAPAPTPTAGPPKPDPMSTPGGRSVIRAAVDRSWMFRTKVTPEMAEVKDYVVKGRRGDVPVRVYRPAVTETGPLPVIVYFHGGGWLFASINASDRATRLIANEGRVIVVSVNYRLSPENVFPAAWDDAEDAWLWARANAASFGGDPKRIGVGGDSAGGNLAANVSARQVNANKPAPVYQLLYYPAVDVRQIYPSFKLFGQGYGLDQDFADRATRLAFPDMDLSNPELSPVAAPSHKGLPATIVATAGFDILRDAGRAYAAKLEEAGVPVTYLNYSTLGHSFLQNSGVIDDADRAATDTARLFGQAIRSRQLK